MKYIPLSNGMKAIVDDDDYEKIKNMPVKGRSDPLRWQCTHSTSSSGKKRYYATKRIHPHRVYLHILIMRLHGVDVPEVMEVDHENNNSLDCRFSNLRIVTSGQNKINSGLRSDNKSGYIGVNWNGS